MNRSTPGLPVHHQLPEFAQTHVHRVGDAIQPSHPLSSPSPPAPSPSQHQSLFQWVNSLHEVAKALEFQLKVVLITSTIGLAYCGHIIRIFFLSCHILYSLDELSTDLMVNIHQICFLVCCEQFTKYIFLNQAQMYITFESFHHQK